MQIQQKISFSDNQEIVAIGGRNDEHLAILLDAFECKIIPRGDEINIIGEQAEVEKLVRLIQELLYLYRLGNSITTHEVRYGIRLVRDNKVDLLHMMFSDSVIVTTHGKPVNPKTVGQRVYLDAIRKNDITIGVGPAGTGKTFLAVAMAVFSLKNREVERIILTRPAVEAGEKLGFLPGDLQEKVDPYLRPLYDALYEILGIETFQKYMAKGTIEVAPLAYMRGRTLDDAFIILDEAQNTTAEQMKMFLTRLGFSSKMVITGDITQIDLPIGKISGLKQAQAVLKDISGIQIVSFDETDVVRHEIVGRIIKAYEEYTS